MRSPVAGLVNRCSSQRNKMAFPVSGGNQYLRGQILSLPDEIIKGLIGQFRSIVIFRNVREEYMLKP